MATYQFYNIINGEKRTGAASHQCTDPRTELPLWDAPIASVEDLDEAVAAANKAQKTWGRSTLEERKTLLLKMVEIYQARKQEMYDIVMKETGKSSLLAEIEVRNTCNQMLYYAQNHLTDEISFEDDQVKIVATHVPLGVVGAICPWNFPLILSNLKVISSLITGNCVIVKPSPFTPYSVLKSIEIVQEVAPPGVLQVLNGGADLGAAMTRHPGIAKITFTGTIATGKRVMEACAQSLKRVTLELAGNDASVVCDDVEVEKVAGMVATGSFFNAGQMCVATKRVYVHESIYDRFLELYVAAVQKGFGVAEDANAPSLFGPVSNKMQFDTVKRFLEDSKKNGHNVVVGGESVEEGKGYWVAPTVVAKPPEDSLLVQEEQFGPIIPILAWNDEDDVVKRANLANAGLGASVYSKDLTKAERIARRLEAGTVWINMPELPNPAGYFAGMKDSGYGGEMGKQGLLSYCYTQSLQIAKA